MRLFVPPPLDVYRAAGTQYAGGYGTYSEYNYLRPGPAAWIKRLHFETALELTRPYFGGDVIDFGCADGPFEPSLARHFSHVCAVDRREEFTDLTAALVETLGLAGVDVVCNAGLSMDGLRERLAAEARRYRVLFLLETLEHVGERGDPGGSRVRFLRDLFTLLDDDGVIVVSVPNMVGLGFAVQRLGLALTGSVREPISAGDFLGASLLCDTRALARRWDGEHLGFDHTRLEPHLRRAFRVVHKRHIFFQVLYVLARQHS
jgi:2-polyprenyl-3-methyl-5-hydroxy-6-metoxy-1,4-benzoquinol methylase